MKSHVCNKNIVLILIASFCYMACPMMVTPLITGYAKVLGASGMIMGVIGGLMNICSLVVRPAAGNLSDSTSKYRLACVGTVSMIVACVCYMAATSPTFLIAARLVHGVGFSCCSVCMSTWMANMLPKEKIGSGMGIFGTMNALSMAIAPSIGIWISERFGHRAAFATAGCFAILTLVIIQFVSDKGLPQPRASKQAKLQVVDVRILPVALIVTLFTIPYCATQSFLVSYVQARQIPVSTGLFFPMYAMALLVLRIGLRKYFDRLAFRLFVAVCSASSVLAMLSLQMMKNNQLLLVAAIFMAGGYGIICSVAQSTAILMAGEGKRGLANSTYYVGLDIGMALGPVIGGVLYGALDIQYFYPVFLVTIPVIFLISMHKNLSRK